MLPVRGRVDRSSDECLDKIQRNSKTYWEMWKSSNILESSQAITPPPAWLMEADPAPHSYDSRRGAFIIE
jgi:hypothetical protein